MGEDGELKLLRKAGLFIRKWPESKKTVPLLTEFKAV